MLGQRAQHPIRFFSAIMLALALLAALLFGAHSRAGATPMPSAGQASVSLAEVHALIFIWASGTPAVQRVAQQTCAQMRLTTPQCAGVSAAVRSGWLDLATRDPAGLGRGDALPNARGRTEALTALAGQLAAATGGRAPPPLPGRHAPHCPVGPNPRGAPAPPCGGDRPRPTA